jgi:hypothetical protein
MQKTSTWEIFIWVHPMDSIHHQVGSALQSLGTENISIKWCFFFNFAKLGVFYPAIKVRCFLFKPLQTDMPSLVTIKKDSFSGLKCTHL